MNEEKRRYVVGKAVTAAVALILLSVILFLLLRPSVPNGEYRSAELDSSISFGDALSVTYEKNGVIYTGTAVKRGASYRAAVSDGQDDIILTITAYKGYVTVSDGKMLDGAVFSR